MVMNLSESIFTLIYVGFMAYLHTDAESNFGVHCKFYGFKFLSLLSTGMGSKSVNVNKPFKYKILRCSVVKLHK